MKKFILLFLMVSGITAVAHADTPTETVTFRFLAGDDMFYVREKEGMQDNAAQLENLCKIIDRERDLIKSGEIPVYVDAYSASKSTQMANRNLSFIRANRVKTELILKANLREDNFVTKNYTTAYGDNKDVVVVTLRLPVTVVEPAPQPTVCEPPVVEPTPTPAPAPEPQPEVTVIPEPLPEPATKRNHSFSIRTNLLYDLLATPTLGVEWRIDNVGIKVDGSWANWGENTAGYQKIWLVSPEIRWYLLEQRRFYVGLGANIGEADLYRGFLKIKTKDTGYKGQIKGGGVTVGYNLRFNRCLSMDFNLGLGVTHFSYDTYTIVKQTRHYQTRNVSKNFWGPTQVGASFVWTIGNK